MWTSRSLNFRGSYSAPLPAIISASASLIEATNSARSGSSRMGRSSIAMAGPGPRGSGDVGAARFDVHGIERLAGGHEQPIALRAAEADIGADLRQADLADSVAVRRKDVDAVVAVANPARGRPDVAVLVGADAVGEADLPIQRHVGEGPRVGELRPIHHVKGPDDRLGLRIVRGPGVGDIERLVVRREAEAVWLERLVSHAFDFPALGIDPVNRLLLKGLR